MDTSARRGVGREPIVVGVCQAVAWFLVSLAVVWYVPRFEKIFKDFGTSPPAATQIAIAISDLLARFWFCEVVLLLVLPLLHYGFVRVVCPRPEPSVWRPVWYIATWLAPLAALLFFALAIAIPLVSLGQRLS